MFWTDIARFLQYFRNLSNSFINIFAILQDFNVIFSKYSFNITVLCGWLHQYTGFSFLGQREPTLDSRQVFLPCRITVWSAHSSKGIFFYIIDSPTVTLTVYLNIVKRAFFLWAWKREVRARNGIWIIHGDMTLQKLQCVLVHVTVCQQKLLLTP